MGDLKLRDKIRENKKHRNLLNYISQNKANRGNSVPIKALLNKAYHFTGFVYEKVRFVDGASGTLLVEVVPKRRANCSISGIVEEPSNTDSPEVNPQVHRINSDSFREA